MASETKLLQLSMLAYEAAAEPELWPGFMKSYTETVSADSSVLQIHDLTGRTSSIVSGFGLSSPFIQSYNAHYSRLNVWRDQGRPLYRAGMVNLSEEQCPRPLLERTEFYNDYLLRIGGAYSMGAVIARQKDHAPTLTALRGHRKAPFGEQEREQARFVLPYLTRAWALFERLQLLAAGESVVDTLPLGVVFLLSGGRATYWNQAADDIFRRNDGLSVRNFVLHAEDRTAEVRLRRAIDHAVSPRSPLGPKAVPIPRTSLHRAYQVTAAPLRRRVRQFEGVPTPVGVVLITDPDRQEPANTDLLIQMYKLTPREAALAAKLSEGKSVEQASREMGITYETARTHLRRIFSKTETSRQAELVLLMARLTATRANQHG